MASALQPLVKSQYAPVAQTTMYTSGLNVVTRIDKATFTNTDTVAQTISVNIVPSGGAAGGANLITAAQSILPGQTFNDPNIYGLYLAAGDFISVIASVASKIAMNIAGTQIT